MLTSTLSSSLQHAPEAIAHFDDRHHRRLSWQYHVKRQQAYAAVFVSSKLNA